jgi:hypothetical protein
VQYIPPAAQPEPAYQPQQTPQDQQQYKAETPKTKLTLAHKITAGIVLLGLGIFGTCAVCICTQPSTTTQPPTQQPAAPASTTSPSTVSSEPQLINEWTGSGDKNTEVFNISQSPWLVEWEFINPEKYSDGTSAAGMVIYVYDVNNSDYAAEILDCGETDSSSYIYRAGTFYLKITPANTSWKIKVTGVP